MTSTLLFVLAALQNPPPTGLEKPVSMTERGTAVADVIEKIAKESGAKLTVEPSLSREPLLVSVKSRPAQEITDAIAHAVCGQWIERNGGLHLVVDKDRLAMQTAASQKRYQDSLAKAIQEALETMQPKDWSGDSGKKAVKEEMDKLLKIAEDTRARNANVDPTTPITIMVGGSMDTSPAHDMLGAIIAKMDAAKFASIAPGESVTYSPSPNRLQQRLGFAINKEAAQFVRQHNDLAEIIGEGKRDMPPGINLRSALLNTQPISGGLGKTLLTVQRDKSGANFSLDLILSDNNGTILNRASTWIGVTEEPVATSLPEFDLKGNEGQAVSVPPVHRELAVSLNQRGNGQNRFSSMSSFGGGAAPVKFISLGTDDTTPFSQEARKLASRPDLHEPLGLATADLMMAFAEAMGTDMVALLPDAMVSETGRALASGQVALGRIPQMLTASNCEGTLQNGLLQLYPLDHGRTWSKRANRKELAGLTSRLFDDGYVELSRVMRFAGGGWNVGGLDRAYLLCFTDEWEDPLYGFGETPAYFKLMARAFPNTEIAPISYNLQVLPTPLRSEVERLLLQAQSPNVIGKGSFIAVSMGGGDEQNQQPVPKLADEPTEKFANGFPNQAVFSVHTIQAPHATLMRHEPSGRASFVTPEELAMRLSSAELGETRNSLDYKSDALTYTPASLQQVRVGIQLTEEDQRFEWFKDGRVQSGTPKEKFGDLAPDFLSAIERTREGMRIGGRAGNRPPPTP